MKFLLTFGRGLVMLPLVVIGLAAFMAVGTFALSGGFVLVQLFEELGWPEWTYYIGPGLWLAGLVYLIGSEFWRD